MLTLLLGYIIARQMTETINKTDILGYGNIKQLLWNYALPAIAAMTAASLYNIIDRILIGQQVGTMAIAGLAITFPVVNLAAAFGALVGSGAATMISLRLGAQKYHSAARYLGNSLVINCLIGLLVTALGLIFLDPILRLFGASEETLPYAHDFMKIILYGNMFMHIYFGLNNILRASGYPIKAMFITLITVAVNILLALVFIFEFKWGIKGAAWATVIAQFCGLLIVLQHFINSKNHLHFRKGYFKLHRNVVGLIFSMGASSFLMNFCACFVLIVLNNSLQKYGGDLAIAAYGIINSLGGLCALTIFGFNLGMQPIVGYNFGARQYHRVLETLRYSLLVGTIISTVCFLGAELFPIQIARAFNPDAELLEMTKKGIRIVFIFFPFVGAQIVASSFFQAIGMPKISIFLSLSRQLICLIPLLLILPIWFELNGVWGASVVSDFISSLLCGIILIYHYRKIKRKANESTNLLFDKIKMK